MVSGNILYIDVSTLNRDGSSLKWYTDISLVRGLKNCVAIAVQNIPLTGATHNAWCNSFSVDVNTDTPSATAKLSIGGSPYTLTINFVTDYTGKYPLTLAAG